MNGPLARRLTLRVGLVVALLAALMASAAWVTTRQIVLHQVDGALRAAADRQLGGAHDDRPGGGPAGSKAFGNPIGTIFVSAGARTRAGEVAEGGPQPVEEPVVVALAALPADGQPRTVDLPGRGAYRAIARPAGGGSTVAAVPLAATNSLLTRLALTMLALGLAAVVLAVATTRLLVVRSLRPLYRVAETARQVSHLELDRGEVELPRGVEAADADPTTEAGRVGLALNHLLRHVETALNVRQDSETKVRQFVADASHELRNPLAAIRGYAELTRPGRADLPPATAHALERIDAESARMGVLVEDLLLLARLDADPQVACEPVDLTALVLDGVADARAAGPDHHWSLRLPDEPVMVLGDQLRLTQVLANLLTNARVHTPPGTRVEVAVEQATDRVRLVVSDNGPGVDPGVRDAVFERFARADASRSLNHQASTGLGLSIVKALVEAMGGQVALRSAPGATAFVVTLAPA